MNPLLNIVWKRVPKIVWIRVPNVHLINNDDYPDYYDGVYTSGVVRAVTRRPLWGRGDHCDMPPVITNPD